MKIISCEEIVEAHHRISNFIINTPLITDQKINEILQAKVFLKLDNLQRTNSFKIRGAINTILKYREINHHFPKKIVVQSSGNHGQAVAWAGKIFNIPVLIYMANTVSSFKVQACRSLGAEVVLCEKRIIANTLAEQKVKEGYFFIHPSDHDDVIIGQGTCAYEALKETREVSAVFASVGGAGLIAGTMLATQLLSPNSKVIGCEPLIANDASQSFRKNKIIGFDDTPLTIADGARTLKISERCFYYLKQIDEMLEISEQKIIEWQEKLSKILQQKIEPTSALAIAGLEQYLKKNKSEQNQKFLVLISGGNL
jgi:threonine dehydratase